MSDALAAASRRLYIARQPIFARGRRLYGYELLHRSGPVNCCNERELDVAAREVVERILHVFGLDALVGQHRAFVNVTRHQLLDETCWRLPPQQTVIELLESVPADADVLSACRALRAADYRLALDDFTLRPETCGLLDVADLIKIDFRATTPAQRARLHEQLRGHGGPFRLLAEKIETEDEMAEAAGLGYDYFQGYLLGRPAMLSATPRSVTGHAARPAWRAA